MTGGVKPFRGTGADARRYVESDRSTADDYYLSERDALASWTLSDALGEVTAAADLGPRAYAAWVDWAHPVTGERMGVPRAAGDGRKGSPRFQEMIVNAPKSLSIAAALHPDVSAALDRAQADAADEIRRYLASHATTRVGPRGAQEVVPAEQLQTVGIVHRTSRAGDPHWHVHFQIGTRVWAAGAWRGLDGVALFKMQGAIRAVGTAVIAAHPHLAAVLDGHGLTLDPKTGEVVELEPFNAVMSKRGAQAETNFARLVGEWERAHPGETMSRTMSGRLQACAWAQDRPSKKPTTLAGEAAWIAELHHAGYDGTSLRRAASAPVAQLHALDARWIANRALDRCAAEASAWTPHTIREQVAALVTETGVRAAPGQLRQFTDQAAGLARADCLSVLPLGAPAPEHVACLTSLDVIAAETRLRDLLTGLAANGEVPLADVGALAAARGLDQG
ncbi:MAG: relaxase domain-containing protein, partial [Bifidobacteriaceae bacterium]|nr:relaxase domain-containing protein [Bifidobacteriaceae bacterium]